MDFSPAIHPWPPRHGDSNLDQRYAAHLANLPSLQVLRPQLPPSHVMGDIKPRLTRDQHEHLEKHFQANNKPTTSMKKGIAESMHVSLDKINNWFQNRRAKVKQELKKAANAAAMYNQQLPVHSVAEFPIGQPIDIFQQDAADPLGEYSIESHRPSSQPVATTQSHMFSHPGYTQMMPVMANMLPLAGHGMGDPLQPVEYPLEEAPSVSGMERNFLDDMYHDVNQQSFDTQLGDNPNFSLSSYPNFTMSPDLFSDITYHEYPALNDATNGIVSNDSTNSLSLASNENAKDCSDDAAQVTADVPGSIIIRHDQNEAKVEHSEPGDFGSLALGRRGSATAALAESMDAVDIQKSDNSKQISKSSSSSSLAARRRAPRPAQLASLSLRSRSHGAVPPAQASPGLAAPDQALRRIKSSGVTNPSRVSKAINSASGQRSPMNLNFAEVAVRHTSGSTVSSPSIPAMGGNLAPPTPITPGFLSSPVPWQQFQLQQRIAKTYPSTNPNGIAVSYAADQGQLLRTSASPPITPQEASVAPFQRVMDHTTHWTPPQSAPAIQQTFSIPPMMPQYSNMDPSMVIADGPTRHRRPSLPNGQGELESQLQYPPVPLFSGNFEVDNTFQFALSNEEQNQSNLPGASQPSTPFVFAATELNMVEYSPPQQVLDQQQAPLMPSPPTTDFSKTAIQFAHYGPRDFKDS